MEQGIHGWVLSSDHLYPIRKLGIVADFCSPGNGRNELDFWHYTTCQSQKQDTPGWLQLLVPALPGLAFSSKPFLQGDWKIQLSVNTLTIRFLIFVLGYFSFFFSIFLCEFFVINKVGHLLSYFKVWHIAFAIEFLLWNKKNV